MEKRERQDGWMVGKPYRTMGQGIRHEMLKLKS